MYSIQNPYFFAGEMLFPSYSYEKIAIKHTHNAATTKQRPFMLERRRMLLLHLVAAEAKITHYLLRDISFGPAL